MILDGIIDCLICDTENPAQQTLCVKCSAPLALVTSTYGAKRDPQIVTVMGDSNVGKTVYLGFLLDMLSLRANQFEAVPKGAYSVDLQQTVISYMAYRMFPPKTPVEANQWKWSYYEILQRESEAAKYVDLVTPDLAGEAIAAEVASPSTFRIIQSLLYKSSAMLLLVDAALAASGSSQPDFFGLKMLSYVESMLPAGKKGRTLIDMPVAVVLTKADYVPACFDDPRRFAEANLNRLWNMCESRFSTVEFFASSVIGSLAYAASDEVVTPIPLHTALSGILEPFEWIIDQL